MITVRAEWYMYVGGAAGIVAAAVVGGTVAVTWPGWAQSLVVIGGVMLGLIGGAAVGSRIEFGRWWP